MDTDTLRILTIATGMFFFGIVYFAFKKGEVSAGGDSIGIDFNKKDNPIGFYFFVIVYIFLGVMSFYISFKL